MDDGLGKVWHNCFTNWPEKVGRRGIVVTKLDDQIPFGNFVTSDSMLMLERSIPDTSGARIVLIPYSEIALLKIVDVVKPRDFAALGFEK
jgi:hypothetical protein